MICFLFVLFKQSGRVPFVGADDHSGRRRRKAQRSESRKYRSVDKVKINDLLSQTRMQERMIINELLFFLLKFPHVDVKSV